MQAIGNYMDCIGNGHVFKDKEQVIEFVTSFIDEFEQVKQVVGKSFMLYHNDEKYVLVHQTSKGTELATNLTRVELGEA